jgi:hypothetical protein
MAVKIVYADPGGTGYHPVLYMARLAAHLFDAELVVVPKQRPTLLSKLGGLLPRTRTGDACVLICPAPSDLVSILLADGWRRSYGRLIAWVFDSFWVDRIPRLVRFTRHFDHVFVTEQEDIAEWRRVLRVPVDCLPWGTDALNLGSANPDRPLDLVRVGRQPSEWEDDAVNARACASRGLHFEGRPPAMDDAGDNERLLTRKFSETKFTLSFSNAVNPTIYTHPKREYMTGRWTDALAAGATVAGIPPRGETVRSVLWDEALLELDTVEREAGLDAIARAVREWTPLRAAINQQRALERLDWRWRLKDLAAALGMTFPKLQAELAQVEGRMASRGGCDRGDRWRVGPGDLSQ